ncbi:hypothetical protein C1H46_003492 [Malus baccata]|uniref:Uncharacterized protein n=1 Tax=Malus baccata TaxID=106549 RepID=A0A540NIT6_MALBA|nr:hypothetical protein C1H46_003492 [Malus baccata]
MDEELGGVVGVNENLIADADSFNLGVGVVSEDISLDTVSSERLRLGGEGDELVGDVDGDLDTFYIALVVSQQSSVFCIKAPLRFIGGSDVDY